MVTKYNRTELASYLRIPRRLVIPVRPAVCDFREFNFGCPFPYITCVYEDGSISILSENETSTPYR